jgi:hypothetical protein
MLMLKRDTEHHSQLGFQLNAYGIDLSEYVHLLRLILCYHLLCLV